MWRPSFSLEAVACVLSIPLLLSLASQGTGAPLFDPHSVCPVSAASSVSPASDAFTEPLAPDNDWNDGESLVLPVNAKGVSQVEIRGRGFTRAVAGNRTCFAIIGESANSFELHVPSRSETVPTASYRTECRTLRRVTLAPSFQSLP